MKPRTKAGRALLRAVLRKDADAIGDSFGPPRDIRERILAIEDEAAAPSEASTSLAADPMLEADLERGAAWREAAAVKGWTLYGVSLVGNGRFVAWALAQRSTDDASAYGPTPTLALHALTEALRERA